MHAGIRFTVRVSLIVALGGFLMGFDASVISGVITFIDIEFELTKIQLGWSVSSLALTATLGMILSGPLSDRIGRRPVMRIAAVLFGVSAIASALAPDFTAFVIARMVGGLGVGAALIIAPVYIAEIAPPALRGRIVSFNQLNIVIGISAAFFSNYLILTLGQSDASWAQTLKLGEWGWRWMLGVEAVPAIIYFFALLGVPESPRWLTMRGQEELARATLARVGGREQAELDIEAIKAGIRNEANVSRTSFRNLFQPSMKLVLTIGISVAIFQQITGINAVFFYSPMIFEQSGIGTNASFMQAVFVGLVNLVFTVLAMALIDRLGRRPLLGVGLAGNAVCMFILAWGFGAATYTLDHDAIDGLPEGIPRAPIMALVDTTYESDTEFRAALYEAIGRDVYKQHESSLVSSAISLNPTLILFAILGFVASFAVSIGPIMWVLFSELFPNAIRGLAIGFVGLVNSTVAFLVTLVFPWELENIGNAGTFLIYGLFAAAGLVFIMRVLPETKGRSLEQLEIELVKA